MKKIVAIGNTVFAYFIAVLPILLLGDGKSNIITFLWNHVFFHNIYIPLTIVIVFGMILYILNIIFLIKAKNGKWSAQELARTNLLVKLIQIPAFLFIFLVGLLCTILIFTIGISLVLGLLDVICIGLTGIFATATFHRLRKEQQISTKMQIMYSIASFLFCVDVITAMIAYRKSKRSDSVR